MKNYYLH